MYTSHEDIGYDFEDGPKDKKTVKPHPNVDGGWAWMVVLSSFFVHILIMGSQMALGVLNVEWLEEFHQSRGLTAWVSSLSMGITLIVGLGSGMVYLPAVVMVGRYFQKHRALAQGLSTTGTGFGTFFMTVLLKYLCAEYGWRNAMIIQGAVSLNLCVCGALMRPLSTSTPRGHSGRPGAGLPEAHSPDSAKPSAHLHRAEDREGDAPRTEDAQGDSPTQGHPEEAGPGRDPPALRLLKTVSHLGVKVRKGFHDGASGYFGPASLFSNRRFVAFVFWALFAYSSFVIPFIHLPEIVHLYGLTEQNDVFPLTSIIAIVHILGKVSLGFVADLPCVRVWNVFLMANFSLVLSIFILPLVRTYTGLAVLCALIGFSSGYFSLMPVVTEDLVGIENLANAYGIIICANGISALLGPPFAGWIYDITQKYDFSFYICGLLYMVGILFLLIQPCLQIIEQSRKKYTDGAHV
ncbi:monocarboxylate transporter 14 isoform X2 [Erinaceus europaeus]|uniref:Monocarboxylate transporter 14 isoform X2 n=1 Tax=Erinaceus europaeus TaxID=9365 RepID=A0ABM3XLQ8_ERIEU|nr:monocarboxylate transporter 14 isoform X2 [Erinaceus europaeus]